MNMFNETKDPEETIFQMVGAASMCWENVRAAGVFESDTAKKIAEEGIARLKEQGVVFGVPDHGSQRDG